MTTLPDILRRQAAMPAAPAAAASLLEPLLAEAAGPGAGPLSLTLDYGPGAPAGAEVVAEAWVERGTRTLVFVHGRLSAVDGGQLVATASAVFRRAPDGTRAP
jgi:acyl-coenzyme A thioesterase PaaI-like protein